MQTDDIDDQLSALLKDRSGESEENHLRLGNLYLQKFDLGDIEESAFNAVNWLMKASRTGNEEATNQLRKCLKNNIGLNEENIEDVEWCVNTSNWEKKGRASARELFKKICMGGKDMTKEEYNKRVAELSNNKLERKLLEKAIKEEVSEEAFVNRMMRQLQGKNTWSLSALMQTQVNSEEYNKLSLFKKSVYHTRKTATWLMDNVVETAGSQGMIWLKALIPVHQIYMLLLLFIYSLVSLNTVLWFLPIVIFFVTFSFVLICTMQMFYSRRKLNDLKALADMLDRFNNTFIHESAESAYSWASITPYFKFFFSLPLLIASFTLADKEWLPCSELFLISLLTTVASWFALSDKYDHLALLSILFDTFSNLPLIAEHMSQIPVLYPIINFISSFGISIDILSEFHIKVGLPSLAYIIVPLLFVEMAAKSRKGFYQIVIPHLVCFFWWRMVVIFFLQTSWFGLVRASCGWGILILLTPLLVVFGVVWTFYSIYVSSSFYNLLKIITTIILVVAVSLLPYWSRFNFRVGSLNLKQKSWKTNFILIAIFLVTSVPLAYISVPLNDATSVDYLPRDVYLKHCGKVEITGVSTSIDCLHFENLKVNWTGMVDKVSIYRVENRAENFMRILPNMISNWLRCTYGEHYADDCGALEEDFESDACTFNKLQGRNCHMNSFSMFTYQVAVHTTDEEPSQSISLLAPDYFKQAMQVLSASDVISFQGRLSDKLAGPTPDVELTNMECVECASVPASIIQPSLWNLSSMYKSSIYAVFNFFFAPLFLLK